MKKLYISLLSFLVTLLGFANICYADAAPPLPSEERFDSAPFVIGLGMGVAIIVVVSFIAIRKLYKSVKGIPHSHDDE